MFLQAIYQEKVSTEPPALHQQFNNNKIEISKTIR